MKIPVVFGTDENYIFPTFVVISSLLQSAHENTEYDIYTDHKGMLQTMYGNEAVLI